jgi:serine protease Do
MPKRSAHISTREAMMTALQNVVRLAALGSAIAWSGTGWTQQTGESRPKDEPVQRESKRSREEPSKKEKTPAEVSRAKQLEEFRRQQRELNDQIRRLTRGRAEPARRPSWPFHLGLQGDWYFSEPRSNELGATFEQADESLRTQLGLPEGQGLVVTSVAPGGPASRVGLRENDVLTTLADKPLATPADLVTQLKAAGEKVVPLQVLRSGKPVTIQVKPEYHVTFGPAEASRSRYQLGVQVRPIDDTLRAQLGLTDRQGLLVTAVEPGSAAETAGIKKHDILMAVGDQSLKGTEDLINQIRKSSGKALSFKVLRGGKTIDVEVTPSAGKDAATDVDELDLVPSVRAVRPSGGLRVPQPFDWMITGERPMAIPLPSERQLGDLRGEVRDLRRSIEQLQKSLERNPGPDRAEK